MTWTCPYCDRDYPDSAIGVPIDNDAGDMRGCKVCWVSPEGTGRFIRPDAVDGGFDYRASGEPRECCDVEVNVTFGGGGDA